MTVERHSKRKAQKLLIVLIIFQTHTLVLSTCVRVLIWDAQEDLFQLTNSHCIRLPDSQMSMFFTFMGSPMFGTSS